MNWNKKNIRSIGELKYGKSLPDRNRKEGKIPVYGSGGIIGYHNQAIVKSGIIIGRKGTVGSVNISFKEFFPIDTVFFIDKVSEENDLKFLYYYLQTIGLKNFDSDAAVPGLNRNLVHKLEGLIPPLSTQQRIASILSAYDDLIEVNNQRIKLLEETAQQLYKEWFVRMRFPGYKKAKFVKRVPEGWNAGSIGDLYSVKSGFAFSGALLGEEGVPIIKITNIQDNGVDIFGCDRYKGELNKRIEKFELFEGDLLIAMTGALIGKIGMVASLPEKYYLNQRVGKFFSKKDFLPNNCFAYFVSSSDYFLSMVENFGMGAAQPNISGEQIERIGCIIPTDEILKHFTKICDPFFKEISNLKTQNTHLRQIRDRLLPRLVSGKLEVKEKVITD